MYDKDTSEPAASWGRFAGSMYFLGERNPPSSAQLVTHRKDTLWCYIITSVLYFFLISVILIILLLAPKYRLSPQPPPVSNNSSSNVSEAGRQDKSRAETQFGTGIGTAVEYSKGKGKDDVDDDDEEEDIITESKEEEFLASPKDPLYIDIDPRSSFEQKHTSGDTWTREGGNRNRMNSKLLEDAVG